jgi:uncharacterized protein (DUF952 family)
MTLIYKILPSAEWRTALETGSFTGSGIDLVDGYIHFSTADTLGETARKHFAGETGLHLLTVDADSLGDALKWEPSRGGELFPHLYRDLPVTSVVIAADLALDKPLDGDAMAALVTGEAAAT